MPLVAEVGLGPGHIVLHGDPAVPTERGTAVPQFSAHVYCDQTAGWIMIPFGTEVGLGPCDIVLDWDPAPPRKGAQQFPNVSARVYCGQTVAHLSNCWDRDLKREPKKVTGCPCFAWKLISALVTLCCIQQAAVLDVLAYPPYSDLAPEVLMCSQVWKSTCIFSQDELGSAKVCNRTVVDGAARNFVHCVS